LQAEGSLVVLCPPRGIVSFEAVKERLAQVPYIVRANSFLSGKVHSQLDLKKDDGGQERTRANKKRDISVICRRLVSWLDYALN
jgi:hypothetical protein